jgi:inorganic triphosphatase YgiF
MMINSPREIELKLELTEDGPEALLGSRVLGEKAKDADLHAIYFDTPDYALHKAGLSLRIRADYGTRVQTIKADSGSAGLFDRDEWEQAVDADKPVPDDRSPLDDLLGDRFQMLRPLFEVPVARQVFRSGDIEIALDQGAVVAGERREDIREIELELLDGDPAALFALAHKLERKTPLRIGVLAKAERGYRLLGERSTAAYADKVKLDPHAALADAFAAIAQSCLRQYRLNEDVLLDQPNPDAVHQARVALRRLRSAMTLFKDVLSPERRALSGRLRDLARVLGNARDLDVLSERVEPGLLRERLGKARDKAYAAMARELRRKTVRRLPLELTEWIAIGAWRSDPETARLRETPLPVFAAKALDRQRKRLHKHGRHFAELDPEHRHEVRKDAKKLRYGVEFLAALFPEQKKQRKAFTRALKHLQELLGTLNDTVAAKAQLAALKLDRTQEGQSFLSGGADDEHDLLDQAAKARHELLEVTPFWDEVSEEA